MPEPLTLDLTGALLVAMPGMGDPRFDRSVVFLCAHSAEGAMGLIVNKPAEDMAMGELYDQLDITAAPARRLMPVHFGGPVETARGFVLHSTDYQSRLKTLDVCDGFGMTATLDVLEDLAAGDGPDRALVMLGYAGWGPGQLEAEIARNGWLTVDADPGLVFGTVDGDKWMSAVKSLGIDPLGLSGAAGRA
ncbi:YqgE/AlgH family protein [uncultured Tateyamaria sp.]|uniref:YqgE/AlgH family protein n=1 Tax=uncultured Tateyamaria sp. TaxID=455651 RepID=UPI0026210DB0|nr:YqgE/AlgH family protein [uncultured Tateyamaria sp.]